MQVEIPDNKTQIADILVIIKEAARVASFSASIRRKAELVTWDKTSDAMKIHAIVNFVRTSQKYQADGIENELIKDPVLLLQDIETKGVYLGDCDDSVTLACAMLLSIGYNCGPVGGMVGESEFYNHVLLGVKINNQIAFYDVTGGSLAEVQDYLVIKSLFP
jgi:hypothetical protein